MQRYFTLIVDGNNRLVLIGDEPLPRPLVSLQLRLIHPYCYLFDLFRPQILILSLQTCVHLFYANLKILGFHRLVRLVHDCLSRVVFELAHRSFIERHHAYSKITRVIHSLIP